MEIRVTGHNFENWPFKDHPCHVCFKLAYWFQRRRFFNIFPIGSYVKTKSSQGGHLEFPIGKRFTNLVQDHPIGLVVSDKKISKISANENTLWTLAAMLDFRSAPKTKSCTWPSNEHFCQVWFKSVLRFQKKRWKCEILIGSNVKLSRVMVAILNFRLANSTGPPNDHSCKVTIQLA